MTNNPFISKDSQNCSTRERPKITALLISGDFKLLVITSIIIDHAFKQQSLSKNLFQFFLICQLSGGSAGGFGSRTPSKQYGAPARGGGSAGRPSSQYGAPSSGGFKSSGLATGYRPPSSGFGGSSGGSSYGGSSG